MEYQKIINFLDNTLDQSSKFRTKNWVETNDESRGTYNTNSQIKFKASMLKSSLFDYSDAYIAVKRLQQSQILEQQTVAALNYRNKEVVFKNCAPFTIP